MDRQSWPGHIMNLSNRNRRFNKIGRPGRSSETKVASRNRYQSEDRHREHARSYAKAKAWQIEKACRLGPVSGESVIELPKTPNNSLQLESKGRWLKKEWMKLMGTGQEAVGQRTETGKKFLPREAVEVLIIA
jgi:hypothetical protein